MIIIIILHVWRGARCDDDDDNVREMATMCRRAYGRVPFGLLHFSLLSIAFVFAYVSHRLVCERAQIQNELYLSVDLGVSPRQCVCVCVRLAAKHMFIYICCMFMRFDFCRRFN